MPTLTIPDRLRRTPKPPPTPDPVPPKGFEYAKAPSVRAAKWTRIAWRSAVVALLALVLVNVVQNIRAANRAATAPSTAAVNPEAARTVAATFAGDYLSHDPLAAPAAGQDVLRRDLAPGGDPARLSFAGIGYLSADLVIPGAVTPVDATHAVVAVQARVVIGMPGNADAASPPAATTTAAAVPGRTANAAALPAGYQVVTTEWLPLSVPVVQTDSGFLVDIPGPVFSADAPPAPAAVLETDSAATAATNGWVKTLFTSYALGSTSGAYLSAPGVDLEGLSGAVTVAGIQSWSLSNPGPDGLRTGSAKVGWTFAPTADLTTEQTYSVTTTTSDNRWYATALGTVTTTDPGKGNPA